MEIDIDFAEILRHLILLGITFLLALPLALNREHSSDGAGLRTFPLVAIASCAFMLVGMSVYSGSDAEARVMYGIITGMGFIGGGSIIKTDSGASGTATAAGIWLTGAIGISVAYSRYEIAIVLSLVGFLIFQFSNLLKRS
ncbi:MgtC/SapB family protein [Pseudohalioglobus lutimaris]|uniref:Protein MgtC n=1 Tax=Pseudohalioglobus lutimaris TaxID=1737061 RepID=A0A2N5X0Z7_9GAMM|nr:MgtC/SapB family protein [Pseudohalioglobus lutimaris]PLW68164.1 magnesium transporter MgtC [Pseudohalioglobus lutimaris]